MVWPFSTPNDGFRPIDYAAIDDDEEAAQQTTGQPQRFTVEEKYTRREPTCSIMSLLIPLAVFMFVVAGYAGFRLGRGDWGLDRTCAAYTTQYSPVLRDVDVTYNLQNFNGSFMHRTIFRQEASDEVDAAWEGLGVDSEAGVISYEDGIRAGLTPQHVQRNEKYGGGFVVNVEGMHHLHCLNLLRKSLYFNVERYRSLGEHAFKNEEGVLRTHITHCLDTVRQVLMCNTDTGVLGQVWYNPEHPKAFPDFNTRHKCKNYDEIRDWAVANQLNHSNQPPDFLAPPIEGGVYPVIP